MTDRPAEPITLADYDYELPDDRIAQEPVEPRDSARLLVVPRNGGAVSHRHFRDLIDLLDAGDLLVVNQTRVTALRLFGERETGGAVETLLLRPALEWGEDAYEALVRPGRKIRVGDTIRFPQAALTATVVARADGGGRFLRFHAESGDVAELLERFGRTPLPPYIVASLTDPERYQTVYARTPGSAAAPTAGLHFTPRLLDELHARGIGVARVRLDVGLGTFRPVRVADAREHEMHQESFEVDADAAHAVNTCRGRVIAVGTTALRALETAAADAPTPLRVQAAIGDTRLFVYPGYRFRAVDGLITNFHQPHSTLLLLVAAFVGREQMRAAYGAAMEDGYRFLSFGDAMLAIGQQAAVGEDVTRYA